jgi:hypothetical protein
VFLDDGAGDNDDAIGDATQYGERGFSWLAQLLYTLFQVMPILRDCR